MESIRYFYGTEYKIATVPVLLDSNNEIITTLGNPIGKKKSTPRVTICSIYDNNTQMLSFGISRCSAKDCFNKKIGKQIAYARAKNDPIKVIKVQKKSKLNEISTQTCLLLEDQVLDYSYPIKF